MDIKKTLEGSTLSIKLSGRLDTTTAPQLEHEVQTGLAGVDKLVLDFADLEYISSAGLRVLLAAQKIMAKRSGLKITHVNEVVAEVFEITGFVDILDIE